MVSSAFMRHLLSQHRVHQAVTHAARWAATYAVPVALSLGVGSLGAIALSPAPALAQNEFILLTNGDQGEQVIRLQQRLAELGFFTGVATGFYGPLTEEAVIQYQAAQGLLADGVAGPETLGALLPSAAPQRTSLDLNSSQLSDLQAKLSRLGFYLGEIDGIYGPQTEAAINSFQSIYGLPVTGVADDSTLATLDRIQSQAQRQTGGSVISVGSSTSQSFPSAVPQTQISTTSVTLPPAIPSGPALVASIPQTTTLASPLPPPSLPVSQASFNSGNFGTLSNTGPNLGNSQAIRQMPQVAAAPEETGFPYVVAVPVKTGATLAEVRQAGANAFLAGSKRGTYIQAGAYTSREDAERATQILRDRRLDARVVYRPQ